MPHKKAKQSVRVQERKKKGSDLPPPKTSSNPALDTNKAASRVLDALKHRQAYRERKKRNAGDDDDAEESSKRASKKQKVDATTSLRIQPGESIQHFSRRVEDDMRPLVRAAAHASRVKERSTIRDAKEERAKAKNKGKGKAGPKDDEEVEEEVVAEVHPTHKERPEKHFATTSSATPKRLNDIAQAPPTFTKVPKGATKDPTVLMGDKVKGIVSMAQRVMMEKERERVVALYRELKAKRIAAGTNGDPRLDED